MFDKLIESNTEGSEFKPRRTYFMVSSVAVGILFLAAVVASIYAGDFSLGSADIEMSQLLAPVEMADAPRPEPQRTVSAPNNSQQSSNIPTRTESIQRIDEPPVSDVETSVVPNTTPPRPWGRYRIDNFNTDPGGPVGTGRDGNGDGPASGLTQPPKSQVVEDKPAAVPPPPPAIRRDPPRVQSLGVINGRASYLPKPPYPPPALALNLQGKVDVQVTIDESGHVVSANAVSGHPLLRPAAEKAARQARFTPTTVSNVPVKVTGVIVYNFNR